MLRSTSFFFTSLLAAGIVRGLLFVRFFATFRDLLQSDASGRGGADGGGAMLRT